MLDKDSLERVPFNVAIHCLFTLNYFDDHMSSQHRLDLLMSHRLVRERIENHVFAYVRCDLLWYGLTDDKASTEEVANHAPIGL